MDAAQEEKIGLIYRESRSGLPKGSAHFLGPERRFGNSIADIDLLTRLVWREGGSRQSHFLLTGEEERLGIPDYPMLEYFPEDPVPDCL